MALHPSSLRPFASLRFAAAVCAAALLVTACKPKEYDTIRVDIVPKETPAPVATAPALPEGHPAIAGGTTTPAPANMGALPGMAEFTAATPTPKWSPPADWAPGAMTATRKGSWVAPAGAAKDQQAEITVTVFQGSLGGLLANVNRWRGRVGLPTDLTEARLDENVQNVTFDGRKTQLVSLDGPNGQSLDGVLVFMPDKVWSLLLAGPTAPVKAQRASFRAFLDGIKWQD